MLGFRVVPNHLLYPAGSMIVALGSLSYHGGVVTGTVVVPIHGVCR
jgi:hypothetical protein